MQRYFAKLKNNQVVLDESDIHHLLHVMRCKKGDEIEVVAGDRLYDCIIESLNPLTINVNYEIPQDVELKNNLTLFFALAKGDKIEFVIQKATEIGAKKIVLIKTERCVVKFDEQSFKNKLERFNKIAKEASEQSHRLMIPEIVGVIDIKNIPSSLLEDINLLAYEKEAGSTKSLFESFKNDQNISVMIGPEGGFSEGEVNLLISKYNFQLVSLGKRILRTETAAVYALSVLSSLMEK